MASTAGHRLTLDPMGKCSNAFFSETTNIFKPKLYMNVHWMVLYKLYVFCSDMKFKMAATAGLSENSSTISDDVHKAELFNEFFSSHMRLHDTNPPPLPHFELLCNNKLEVLETSESEVLKLLSKINIHKSSGSDGLNNIILRKCAHTLCKPFTKI
jgi:hypothetical protein